MTDIQNLVTAVINRKYCIDDIANELDPQIAHEVRKEIEKGIEKDGKKLKLLRPILTCKASRIFLRDNKQLSHETAASILETSTRQVRLVRKELRK